MSLKARIPIAYTGRKLSIPINTRAANRVLKHYQ